MEEAPEQGRFVAVAVLGGVLLGFVAFVCSILAAVSPLVAAEVFMFLVGLIVLVWLVGSWIAGHRRA